jgi:heptosyltransferase-3
MINPAEVLEPTAIANSAPIPDERIPPMLLQRNMALRILVIKLRHFGDVLLITPLLSTLELNYPHALIDVLLYAGTEALLTANKTAYLTYTVDRELKHQGIKAQFRGEKALWNSLSYGHYDLIINLSDQWRAALYCRFLKPGFSLGFCYPKRNNRAWRACHSLLVDTTGHTDQHTVLNNLSILAPLGLPAICQQVTLAYRPMDSDHVALLCRRRPLTDYVVIQPTARWAFKSWSTAAFGQLINHLIDCGEGVVLTGGRSTAEFAAIQQILAGCEHPERVTNLAGKLDMPELAAVIDRAKLFIGVDSAPMHMAAALQTPSVVLFGPSNLKQWHPWQAPYTLLWAGDYRTLPSPDQIDTDTPERYLDAIPVNDVILAVDRQLASLSSSVPLASEYKSTSYQNE